MLFQLFLGGSLVKAELKLHPERCDAYTVFDYLEDFGFSRACLDKICAIGQFGDAFAVWRGCFSEVSRSDASTLGKLIAILYLCEIGAMQIEALKSQQLISTSERRLIGDLSQTIRERIKVFDQERFYNLLTTDALRNLLQMIRQLLDYKVDASDTYADIDTYTGYFSAHRSRSDSVSF